MKLEPKKLPNERWSFVDENGNVLPYKFRYVNFFHENFATVRLENDDMTFIDKKGVLLAYSFKKIYDFHEGFACVQFHDGNWTFMDKEGKLSKHAFKEVENFYEGFARVQMQDESYTFVDKNLNIMPHKFRYAEKFNNRFAYVRLNGNKYAYLNKNGNIIEPDDLSIVKGVYKNPELFMTLPTKMFKNDSLIDACVFAVKSSIKDKAQEEFGNEEEVDDEYLQYAENLVGMIKQKISRAKSSLAEKNKDERKENRKKLETLIKDL